MSMRALMIWTWTSAIAASSGSEAARIHSHWQRKNSTVKVTSAGENAFPLPFYNEAAEKQHQHFTMLTREHMVFMTVERSTPDMVASTNPEKENRYAASVWIVDCTKNLLTD